MKKHWMLHLMALPAVTAVVGWSKDCQYTSVSGIIKETEMYEWNNGQKQDSLKTVLFLLCKEGIRKGEQSKCCRWQKKRGEPVATVGRGRRHLHQGNCRAPQQDGANAHTGASNGPVYIYGDLLLPLGADANESLPVYQSPKGESLWGYLILIDRINRWYSRL